MVVHVVHGPKPDTAPAATQAGAKIGAREARGGGPTWATPLTEEGDWCSLPVPFQVRNGAPLKEITRENVMRIREVRRC